MSSDESHSASNNSTLLALGIVLSIVGCLTAGAVVFITYRIHKRRSQAQFAHRRTGSVTLDKSHPASRIVPFGTPGVETPRFIHTPGVDMRVAHRRSDGGWEFSPMGPPLTPGNMADMDPLSGRTTPTFGASSPSLVSGPANARDAKKGEPKYGFAFDDCEPNPHVPPPPAYMRS